jgi:hypothetical protein
MSGSIDLTAAISVLMDEMESKPDDLHEVHLKLQELLRQFRATGMPLPDDLVRLEQQLKTTVEGVPEEKFD